MKNWNKKVSAVCYFSNCRDHFDRRRGCSEIVTIFDVITDWVLPSKLWDTSEPNSLTALLMRIQADDNQFQQIVKLFGCTARFSEWRLLEIQFCFQFSYFWFHFWWYDYIQSYFIVFEIRGCSCRINWKRRSMNFREFASEFCFIIRTFNTSK